MGKNSDLKQIRGQIRQIVKELMPELLNEQLVASIEKRLSGQLYEGLNKIDERQKELQSYFIRNVGVPTAPKAEDK